MSINLAHGVVLTRTNYEMWLVSIKHLAIMQLTPDVIVFARPERPGWMSAERDGWREASGFPGQPAWPFRSSPLASASLDELSLRSLGEDFDATSPAATLHGWWRGT